MKTSVKCLCSTGNSWTCTRSFFSQRKWCILLAPVVVDPPLGPQLGSVLSTVSMTSHCSVSRLAQLSVSWLNNMFCQNLDLYEPVPFKIRALMAAGLKSLCFWIESELKLLRFLAFHSSDTCRFDQILTTLWIIALYSVLLFCSVIKCNDNRKLICSVLMSD